jgi:hypothetical protein
MNREAGLNLLVRAATEAIQQWARDIKKMRMGILIFSFANMVIEPACFDRKPDALYGVEVGPIGRKIHRVPVVPIAGLADH